MNLEHEPTTLDSTDKYRQGFFTVVTKPCSTRRCVLYLTGPLGAPVSGELRHNVRVLLRRGERIIVLDLGRVSRIDAAGVGELVRAYNMARAVHSVLHITRATACVQEILERV